MNIEHFAKIGAIKNGQSRNTGDIGHKDTEGRQTKEKKNTTQKDTKMNNMDPTKTLGVNPCVNKQ